MSTELILQITTVATSVFGAIGILFGFIKNKKNQTLKRQEIIFPLMKEFDTDKNIHYAKELVDATPVQIKDEKENIIGKYTVKDLQRLLNEKLLLNEIEGQELTENEIIVRTFIDSLLNFFGKLAYLLDIKVLTRQDIGYFEYYIEIAATNTAVMQFAKRLRYELFLLLLYQTGYIDNESRNLVQEFKKRTRQKRLMVKLLQI